MRQIVFGLIALLCAASWAEAQQGTADLRGRVVDALQAAMPGVTITVRNQDSGLFRETVTTEDGTFFLSAMTPGTYRLEAMIDGFRPFQRGDILLAVGRTTTVEVPLEVGGLSETVTVTGEAPLIDTTSKEVGGSVNTQDLVNTPSLNRDFTGYLAMLPGVVSTIQTTTFGAAVSAGGQNTRNVSFNLDGSNNNDALTSGSQGAQARIPVEAIQEFKLLTSQFDAEYGNTSGSVVNAVSKQGTNAFRGSLFGFYQDQDLAAMDYFAKSKGLSEAPTKQSQFGGSIGGPMLKDKAHFFFALERIILDQGIVMNIPTRPDLNRTDFQITRVWNTFIRFDNQINSANTWGLRWLRDSSPQPLQLNPTWTHDRAGEETDVDQSAIGNLSSVLGNTKVNTFRVSYTSEVLHFANPNFLANGFNQRALLPQLDAPSFSSQQSATASVRLLYGVTTDDVFSWFVPNKAGDHELKFGVSHNYTWMRLQDFGNENGTFTFATDAPFNAADPRTYPERFSIRVPGTSDFRTHAHFLGGFAQDKWKMGNNLTVSLGARYDIELARTPNADNPLFAGLDKKYPIDANNVSPRVGFSYALNGGRSALRGGVGLFYQITSLSFLTPTFTSGPNSGSFLVSFPTNNIDPGPRNGQLPTSPQLANGPVVDHALISQLYPAGTLLRNTGTVRLDHPDRKNAWSRQYSVGYETQLGDTFAVSVDLVRSEQRDQYMTMDLNPAVRSTGLATGSISRTNPLTGTVGQFAARVDSIVNVGSIDYDSLQFAGTKRYDSGFSARLSYALSRGRGTTATGQADTIVSQYLGDLRLDTQQGPTDVDRPHIASLSANWDLPKTGGLKLSGVLQARSGTPFSLINTSLDTDRNGSTANEYLAAGTYSGTGTDAVTVDYAGGRNGARGPSFVSLDVRAGYRLGLPGGRSLDAFLDVFNITDHVNFVNPSGDQRVAGTFLKLTSTTGATRTAQLNFRYGF